MPKSHSQIMAQIEKLQKEAAALQTGVINSIKKQIAQHGLTAEHLFGGVVVSEGLSAKSKSAKPTASKPKAAKVAARPAKFGDDQGNTWAGMGKRPDWLRAALDAGRSMEEFFLGKKTKAAPATKPKASSKASAKASKTKPVAAVVAPVKASAKPAGKKAALKKPVAVKKAAPAKKVATAKPTPAQKASPNAGKPAAKRVVTKAKAVKKAPTSPAQVDQASA